MLKWTDTKTACLRFALRFAYVAFKEIYYLRARIHFIFHFSQALPPYSKYPIIKQHKSDRLYYIRRDYNSSIFFFIERQRKDRQSLRVGNWFPWLSGLVGCVTYKRYAILLCWKLYCFSVCICAGIPPLMSGAGQKQAWTVC